MKVRVLREFYGDQGNARTGQEIVVSRTTGTQLKARGLVEIIDETEGEEDEAEEPKVDNKAAEKAAPAPDNKAQAKPSNKSASKAEAK